MKTKKKINYDTYWKEYWIKNKEVMLKRKKFWRKNNPEKAKAWLRENRKAKRMELLGYLGGRCKNCGFADWRALQIDHINGGGHAEMKKVGISNYQHHLLESVKKFPDMYQLLCANCNWIKRYKKREFYCGTQKTYEALKTKL